MERAKEREEKKISSSFEIFFFSPAAHARQNCDVVVPESYERIIINNTLRPWDEKRRVSG